MKQVSITDGLAHKTYSGKIRLITIWAAAKDEWDVHLQKAIETLDYKAIKQVMYKR